MRNNSAMSSSAEPHHVVALALADVVAFDLSIPAQVFGHVEEREHYRFTVCTEHPGRVPTTTGFDIHVDAGLDAIAHADTVIVPGFRPLDVSEPVRNALRAAAARGVRMVSICTGAFALAAAGLLDGRRATTHWTECAELARRFPAVQVDPKVLFVDEGDIMTSAGSAAGIDLCLHIVRQDYGTDLATQLARQLVVPPQRDGGQAQYIDMPMPGPGTDGLFAGTLAWLQEHLAEPVTIGDLAARSAMSPRTFARRFQAALGLPPYQWLVSQRIRLAQRLLETTSLTIDSVAAHSGFSTAANLRKHFSQAVHTSPQAYRRTFARRHAA